MTPEMIGGLFLRININDPHDRFCLFLVFFGPASTRPATNLFSFYATNETDATRLPPRKVIDITTPQPWHVTIRFHELRASDYVYKSTPTIPITSHKRRLWRRYAWRSSRFVPCLYNLVRFLALLPGFLSSDATHVLLHFSWHGNYWACSTAFATIDVTCLAFPCISGARPSIPDTNKDCGYAAAV